MTAAEVPAELDEGTGPTAEGAGALTGSWKGRTADAAPPVASEEFDGGDPGGVVLKEASRLCRVLLSALSGTGSFGRPVSSTSLVWILDRLSSDSS